MYRIRLSLLCSLDQRSWIKLAVGQRYRYPIGATEVWRPLLQLDDHAPEMVTSDINSNFCSARDESVLSKFWIRSTSVGLYACSGVLEEHAFISRHTRRLGTEFGGTESFFSDQIFWPFLGTKFPFTTHTFLIFFFRLKLLFTNPKFFLMTVFTRFVLCLTNVTIQ